jgi:chaperonin GroEL
VNKEKGTLACAAVKAPGQGDRRRSILQDIAILTGGTAFLQEHMRPLEGAALTDLGCAQKIIVTRQDTTIIGGKGKPEEIQKRINELRRQIEASASAYDVAKLRERLAKLVGAIAVIKCGGATDSEREDNRYRVESALSACQSAIESGYVVGGGLCYYRARRLVEKLIATNDSEQEGINAVSSALETPLRQLVQNSRAHNKAELLSEVAEASRDTIGFNAERERVEDLTDAGVLDSAIALKEALVLALAHAKGVLTTAQWDAAPTDTTDPHTL